MKKLILTAAAMIMLTVPVMAADAVTVYSNGNEVADKGIIIDGRTMVPVRGVFEYMGYSVEYNANTKTATLTNTKKETTITLTNGENTFTVNDNVITPEVPQQIINGKFMLPLRAVGEAVNAKVGWNNETKTATINENNNFFSMNEVDKDDPIIDEMPVNEITSKDNKDAEFEALRKQAEEQAAEMNKQTENK